ncbi:transposase [Mesorhizobium sp. M1403]|uniref:transposase n=1 Tax=Mesorhizobium sp. M1403 TaxID=2957097 RepID=UPI003334E775
MIAGPTGRRQRSQAEKARIVAECFMPGVRVAEVARKHEVTRWQVYDWKQLRSGGLALPESMTSGPAFAALVVQEPSRGKATGSSIELVVGDVVIGAEPSPGV